MTRLTRYPNQFFEPTPIASIEVALGPRREASHQDATPSPVAASGSQPHARHRARPRHVAATRIYRAPARVAAMTAGH